MQTDPVPLTTFLVPAGFSHAEHRVRGSRFLATAGPVSEFEEALEQRDVQRRRHHDASHHVWGAMLLGGESRSDDDGEPSGTAGRPILTTIEGAGIRNVAVVVTRYFGGVKLGTGGLSRAYARAAALALASLVCDRVAAGRRIRLKFAYGLTGAVSRVLDGTVAERLADAYGESVTVELAVAQAEIAWLWDRLSDATAGRVEFEDTGEPALVRIAT